MFSEVNKKVDIKSKSTEVDVRDDEEQAVKFDEIIEMLVAAGYYRARIKGLANFDKIVGGMTWCIESCYFDVDVDLLFQENLTIGQKIALTEKIVVMLPKMNCPHRIEPHQIQGLDSIHIFPVMQWLVKESMYMRETMADYVRSFAINQFNNKYCSNEGKSKSDKSDGSNPLAYVKLAKKTYELRQHFKRKDAAPTDEFSIVSNTLLEYGEILKIPQKVIDKLQERKLHSSAEDKEITKEIIERKKLEQNKVEELIKNLLTFDDSATFMSNSTVGKIVNIHAQEVAKASEQYLTESTSVLQNEEIPSKHVIAALEKQRLVLENKIQKKTSEKDFLKKQVIDVKAQLEEFSKKKQSFDEAFNITKQPEFHKNRGLLEKLERLLAVRDGLKDQDNEFREQCRLNLNIFNELVEKSKSGVSREEIDNINEYEEQKKIIHDLRLLLAKKNRTIAILTRQLDDIPGRSELTQYQRRFMELYNQVSTKHKETKQYYTLYNTLDDTKLYLSKELSLLNSIQDNYYEAMASSSGREQFIKQFEMIVDGVQKNKQKAEKRYIEEKNRRDILSRQLMTLMEQQRRYIAAVRQLTIECRKNEAILVRLRGL